MNATVKRALDLPEDKNFTSDFHLKPLPKDNLEKGTSYAVEISFTLSGKQQIGIKEADIDQYGSYSKTRPIDDIFGKKP